MWTAAKQAEKAQTGAHVEPDSRADESSRVDSGTPIELLWLPEACGRQLSETWQREYNTIRPHSRLGYLPSAPASGEGDDLRKSLGKSVASSAKYQQSYDDADPRHEAPRRRAPATPWLLLYRPCPHSIVLPSGIAPGKEQPECSGRVRHADSFLDPHRLAY